MLEVKAFSSGITDIGLSKLQEQALDLGRTTRFSAGEVGGAMAELARSGFDAGEIGGSIPGILNLAAAGQLDIGSAADIAAGQVRAFRMEVAETTRVADVMASAASNSRTTVVQIGEAMEHAASLASTAGYDIEQASAAVAVLAERNIKGSEGGTALRGVIATMLDPTKQKNLLEIGVDVVDESGNLRGLADVVDRINNATAGMTGTQRGSVLRGAGFEMEQMRAILALVQAGGDELREMEDTLRNSRGESKRLADVLESGMGGAVRELRAATEGLGIALYDLADGPLKKSVGLMAELTREYTGGVEKLAEIMGAATPIGDIPKGQYGFTEEERDTLWWKWKYEQAYSTPGAKWMDAQVAYAGGKDTVSDWLGSDLLGFLGGDNKGYAEEMAMTRDILNKQAGETFDDFLHRRAYERDKSLGLIAPTGSGDLGSADIQA